MSQITDLAAQLDELRKQVQVLQDHSAIIELIDRYGKALDEKRWEDWEDVFAEDAVTNYPWGHTEGRAGMARKAAEILKDFTVTEHLSGNILVELNGDRAKSRRNVFIVCVRPEDRPGVYFTEGGVYHCEHVRTPAGWKFSRVLLSIKWNVNGNPL